jgi:hypothetical protein
VDRRNLAAVCCFACLLAGPALAAKLLAGIPLQWTPRTSLAELGPLDISGPLLTARVRVEPFTDRRAQPALIAENREGKEPRPVTTSTDVAAFVTLHVTDALRTAGLTLADDRPDFTVSGEVRQFFVTETTVYRGEMSLLVHVRNAAGAEVWSGVINGAAENFGRSYRPDNYYETISDMILRASHDLLANPSLHRVLVER